MKTRIVTIAEVPQELAQAWLQHLRDFDTAHPGSHFAVVADMPNASTAELLAALEIEPPLPVQKYFKREDKPLSTKCGSCGAPMIPGPRGGAAQNFYCTDRIGCRQGENLTIWLDEVIMGEPIGEVGDETYEMYKNTSEGSHGKNANAGRH